jgi:bacterioferritin-associated ferredoxin
MPIDRCVCFNVPFSTLKEYAIQHSCGLKGLRAKFGCGRGCALCVPYIRAMLRSGRTSFDPAVPPNETPEHDLLQSFLNTENTENTEEKEL